MNSNIEYYNNNAQEFFDTTIKADMSQWRDIFESYVWDGGRILDAGCGSGRDSKAFLQHGFAVEAFDASGQMCRRASELIAQTVWQMRFDEISFDEEFDGIWACASLLHVSHEDMPTIFKKLNKALKDDGAMYASFKYGEGTLTKGERTFSNYTLETIKPVLEQAGFDIVKCEISQDVREDRADEKWLNVICKKAQ